MMFVCGEYMPWSKRLSVQILVNTFVCIRN